MRRPTEQLHRYNICGRPTLYRSVFSLKKDKAPETAVLGISCFRGSACSICTIIFPFSGNPHREHEFFRRGETAASRPSIFLAGIQSARNRSLSHPPRCESIKVGESANSARQLCSFQKPDVVVQVGGLGIPVSGSRVRKRMGTITKN